MISRQWKGVARPGHADAYVRHLKAETFPQLAGIPGFVRASILRRQIGAETEFQIVTIWSSLEAIEAFAGRDIDGAVVPEGARALLSTYDATVLHYEIIDDFTSRDHA